MSNIQLVQGDAMNLPFDDNEFDYVTIGFGLRNIPDYVIALKEMNRVLKPGGMAVCLETSQPTIPVFKQGYQLYFKFVMPIFGKLLQNQKNTNGCNNQLSTSQIAMSSKRYSTCWI